MKSCFLIGHRETPATILPELETAVEQHIVQHNVQIFYVGNYGAFDRLAAQAVMTAKARHPDVALILLLPYHPEERPVVLPRGFDGTHYPEGMECVPRRAAIVRANRSMVERVDYLIAYAWHPASNARNLLEYAKIRAEKGLIGVTCLGALSAGLDSG